MAEPVKTHWKKLTNPDYIGAYALEKGKDMILTIKSIKREIVTGNEGKKEECTVAFFKEDVKPMILNATNSKTIQKLYSTPYIEEWVGRKIQIFADMVKVKGEPTEALRIRPYIPKQTEISTKCADCSKDITGFENKTAEQIAQYTYSKYGKTLCTECATKEANKGKVEDPL
jgi:ribosomal protein L34E